MSTSSSDEGLSIFEQEEAIWEEERSKALDEEKEEEEEDDDMKLLDVDVNPAHKFLEYKSGLNLGILKEFLEEGNPKTLEECIDKLNDYVVQVMDSSSNSVTFQVLTETDKGEIKWKTTTRTILESMLEGFCVEVEKEVRGKVKMVTVSVAKEYFKSLDRNWVKYMKYDPRELPGIHGHTMLNTFMGFPFHNLFNPGMVPNFAPQDVKIIEVIVFHLYEVLCRGNKEIYQLVKEWLRMVRQHPWFRPEVVLVFIGEEGTGKSQFFKYYARIFGRNAVYLADPKSLLTKFSGDQMDDKVLICCDEANFSNDACGSGLKNLVTAEERKHEKKGLNAKQIKNYLNGIFTTNKKDCLPVDSGRNRRYFPVHVNDEFKDDLKYFDELERHIDNPHGMAVFDFWLRCKKVAPRRIRPPVTEELNNMKVSAMNHLHNWWLQILDDGRHVSSSSLTTGTFKLDVVKEYNPVTKQMDDKTLDWILSPVDISQLHAMYQTANMRNPLRRADFVIKLRELLPKDGVKFSNEDIKNGELPPLATCKEFAHKKLGVKSTGKFIGSEKNERKRKRWQSTIPEFFSGSGKRACRSPSSPRVHPGV